jgi:hypothetical protein
MHGIANRQKNTAFGIPDINTISISTLSINVCWYRLFQGLGPWGSSGSLVFNIWLIALIGLGGLVGRFIKLMEPIRAHGRDRKETGDRRQEKK